jgi:hypothetical protein
LGKTITIPLHQTASYFTMGLIRFWVNLDISTMVKLVNLPMNKD